MSEKISTQYLGFFPKCFPVCDRHFGKITLLALSILAFVGGIGVLYGGFNASVAGAIVSGVLAVGFLVLVIKSASRGSRADVDPFANRPVDEITSGELEKMFPTHMYEKLPELERKMAAIPVEMVHRLIGRGLVGSWLALISQEQIKTLNFSRLSARQVTNMFPIHQEELTILGYKRLRWLTNQQLFDRNEKFREAGRL